MEEKKTLKNITKQQMQDLYLNKKFSISQIAKQLSCSQNGCRCKIISFGIPIRSVKDACNIGQQNIVKEKKTERKIINFESKILEDKTYEKFGYTSDKFGNSSAKKIIASCRYCGNDIQIKKNNFTKQNSACHKECSLKELSQLSPMKNKQTREKAKARIIQIYGVQNAIHNPDVLKKCIQKRNSEQTINKIINTMQTRYGKGIVNNFQVQKHKQKAKNTCMLKYGVPYAIQNKIIKDKSARTRSSENNKELSHDISGLLSNQQFWLDLQNLTLQQISIKNNVNQKSLTSILGREDYIDRFHKVYKFPYTQTQKQIFNEITNLGVVAQFNTRGVISPKELDIYIPQKKIAIQFNGSYWHSQAHLQILQAQKKHFNKTKLCELNGIQLIHIFQCQWRDRKSQILNYIKSKICNPKLKIGGIKCTINNEDPSQFIQSNHIQGKSSFIKSFNLIFNEQIVGSLTLGKHHRKNDGKEIVLNRLCFKDGVSIIGGSEKLFKAAKIWAKQNGYQKIVSWSDNSLSNGNVYKKLNFVKQQELKPDYFYWDSKNNVYLSKQSQKKDKTGCPKQKKQRDFALQNNLYRIWDCGKIRWTYIL